MARRPGHILPFRIPFFRIFYSTTYTTIYIITLCFLAITPISMLWQSIQTLTLQYAIMIGGTYLLTAIIAIFIYASRLYTNRTVMAGVGKAYIPVEKGELGHNVRRMIVRQFERSAMVAWESRPRDLVGEILHAEQLGVLPPETTSVGRNDYTVGREIPVDPAFPPWGEVRHFGWSSPSQRDDNEMPHLQFAPVIDELPNLIEARAVSLAPPDPMTSPSKGLPMADPVIVDVLRRPETMGMRDYLTQLSYLGLINPPEIGQSFLHQYENARFGGLPITEAEFKRLMSAFADLLSGMTSLAPAIIDQIRLQTADKASILDEEEPSPIQLIDKPMQISSSPPRSPDSSILSPVTARTAPSRTPTPYLHQEEASRESMSSVIHQSPPDDAQPAPAALKRSPSPGSSSLASEQSESGSVVRHRPGSEDG